MEATLLGEATLVESLLETALAHAELALALALGLGALGALRGSAAGASDVDGLGLAGGGVLLDLELDGLTIGERAETLHVDVVLMDEEVVTALSGGDEAEAALGVEELDDTGGHFEKRFLTKY